MASNFFEKLNDLKQRHDEAADDGTILQPMRGYFAKSGDPVPLVRRPTMDEWEARTQANLQRNEAEAPFILFICSHGISPWSDAGRAMMADLKSGKIALPTKDGQPDTARILMGASADASSQNAPTKHSVVASPSKVSGVYLQKPPTKISL